MFFAMDIHIRTGEEQDVPALLNLIKELAAYEKAPAELSVSEQQLRQDGFGEQPAFRFFVAEAAGAIVGIALYYMKYSTWKGKCVFLEDIIVAEAYRRNGIGNELFRHVCLAAKKMQVQRLEWQVLEWNSPAIDFYKKHNAQFDGEWINCKLTYTDLQAIK